MKSKFEWYDMTVEHDPYKVGFLPTPEEVALESPLSESQLLDSADEVFFYGVNSKSEYLITRIARGTNGEAEAWIYLKLRNGKIYQLQETSGFQQSCSDKRTFSCGDLQIHYLSPMRRWRIFFNGLLRETSDDNATSDRMVHVKLSVIWRASTDAFDFASHVDSKALASGLSRTKWNKYSPPLEKLYRALNFYAQCGIIMGTINIEGSDDEQDLYLFGERIRFLGDVSSVKGFEFFDVLGYIYKNGRYVHLIEVSIPNVVENFTFGFTTTCIGGLRSITDTKSVLKNLTDKEKDEYGIEAEYHTEESEFVLKGALTGRQRAYQSKKGWDGCLTADCLNFELNSLKGTGIVLNGKIIKPSTRIISQIQSYPTPSVFPLVVHFSEKICQNPDVTGGKGSSLGKLTELSKDFQNFIVPNGVVVTTSAYELFITNSILRDIKKLESVLYNDKVDETKIACQRLIDEITKSSIPDQVLQAVVTSLQKVFPDRKDDHQFAVRSSATGEDTEQMSAAGQMDTYLGVSGIRDIISSVKKCWASQFSYIAVQYKRQNGQVINSPMAVVIQQMVSCDVAGVLFTCDPLTGNPSVLSITANYGLGESVVSGAEEPDTIEIDRRNEDNLTIKNKLIGSKSRRIILKDDGGTKFEEVSDKEKQACSLTDTMALRLANLAVKIEKSYGSRRDIEWGFWNNNLYIFQSRPVTSGTGETDYEIDHEFDGPLRVENEYFAMCNVGEVMPGATSPLGMEIILKFFNMVFQNRHFTDFPQSERCKYYPRGIVPMYNHAMFYAIDIFQHINENRSSVQATVVGLFGRLIEEDEMFDMAMERHRGKRIKSRFNQKENLKRFIRVFYGANKKLRQTTKSYEKYQVHTNKCSNSQEIFSQLLYSCTDLSHAMGCHMICSEGSSMLNIIIFIILQKAMGEINADVYSDFSHLLTTSSDVESADVPAAIERLAFFIFKDIKPEDFKRMNTDFDIRSCTWGKDPKSLVQFLQNLVGSVKSDRSAKKQEDLNKIISEVKAPLTFMNKLLLRILLPKSRKAVQNRECSKSLLIRALNEWRKGYRNLAKMMVLEGRIPDEDLLYFMTLEEIQELLDSRSPRIISKANHRRRRQPTLDKYIFPEIMRGLPKPINVDRKVVVNNDNNFSMKGIPVSQGVAKGVVRVALDLEEASHLQPGEILVTYSTDIGWSPYFPILGGVVTELGGLISHGAVVSREYGLPCIAGLHGATQQFKTGDYVLIDGTKGILQRIPNEEDS
ncbi:putative phosphoenolpyruvate synthase [Nephila pilipes]|uniref:Putative phosphoenolpyruvate synthase n=1 Tax=Nephila pilipes TaxID=299642 RepID=A0A8X6NRK2_NEPPI|nr:putative phosphoenolpyruvate synthase [Nephila pilipes]